SRRTEFQVRPSWSDRNRPLPFHAYLGRTCNSFLRRIRPPAAAWINRLMRQDIVLYLEGDVARFFKEVSPGRNASLREASTQGLSETRGALRDAGESPTSVRYAPFAACADGW